MLDSPPLQEDDFDVDIEPTPVEGNKELMQISMTISKQKGHVPPMWAKVIFEWMKKRCERGSVSLERGGKQQNLHLQIILEMYIELEGMNVLKVEIKRLLGWKRGDGSGLYVAGHFFGVGQDAS